MGKRIWVAVRGELLTGGVEVKAASTFKGICDKIGLSVITGRSKQLGGVFFMVSAGKGLEERVWMLGEVEVSKVKRVGNIGRFRKV